MSDVTPEPTPEDVAADPNDTIGQRVDAAVAALRSELMTVIDALQAKVDEVSAKVDAAQGQSQAQ